MEKNEVSLHMLKVYLYAESRKDWFTAKDCAKTCSLSDRTGRAHCKRLTDLGVFDLAEVFPAHRYKLSDLADKRNKAMVLRLEHARTVFASDIA